MDTTSLLQKLIEIEQAVDSEELATIRRMIIEAQECLLGFQKSALTRLCPVPKARQQPLPN
ncbi:MAG TPA: hypothetical protein VMU48_10330 [Terracidiphilus sp.]|nr:hypothetical protein [Terracidiphilus sp.]